MKVILKQTVPNLGKEDSIVTVAGGYARNFLFPRGLATVADRGQLKALEAKRTRVEAKLAATKAAADSLKEKLDGLVIEFEANVAKEGGRLFGAFTAQDIADAIEKKAGVKLEKKQVGILEPIKSLGSFAIALDLHRYVDANITVNVMGPDGFMPGMPAAVPAEEVVEEEAPAEAVEA
ncbi:MAG: 50S ribosomal protein L9 [Chthonomonas sp.]|nr:50S ribosomal protein L9 [Chthonomonas sp.]